MEVHAESEWYPGKLNPHPLGSAPERFEPAMSSKERQHRDREDAKRLDGLNKKLQRVMVNSSYLRAARDQVTGPLYALRNVKYVEALNSAIEIREEIAALFTEQEQ